MKNRVVITGGAGFIGSHVTKLFCDNNYDVAVIDDLRFGYKKNIDSRASFIQASLEDIEVIPKCDVVVHLAASSIIADSYIQPIRYYENNVINGVRVLEAMKKNNIQKIIYTSTSSIYGPQTKMPINETVTPNPLHAYAASKLSFEQILASYHNMYNFDCTSLRLFNVYGPNDDQKPRTRAIPMWIEAILADNPVPWYWHGAQVRDYVYVEDVAKAVFACRVLSGNNYFNVGSGSAIKMKDMRNILEKVIGKKMIMKNMGTRKGDSTISIANITKIYQSTGWMPKVQLMEGLSKTYQYYAH